MELFKMVEINLTNKKLKTCTCMAIACRKMFVYDIKDVYEKGTCACGKGASG